MFGLIKKFVKKIKKGKNWVFSNPMFSFNYDIMSSALISSCAADLVSSAVYPATTMLPFDRTSATFSPGAVKASCSVEPSFRTTFSASLLTR